MSITIHQTGIDAAINAQASGFDGVTLSKVELWSASTKIKALALEGVTVIEPGRIYVVAVDSSADVYEVFELRFYTDTDALYATAKNADSSIIQAKAAQSSLVLAHTLNISAASGTVAASGDLSMFAPPADEEKLGTVVYAKENDLEQKTQQRKVLSPSWLWKWWDSVRSWGNIKDKPSIFPPSSHQHGWNNITDKPSIFPPSSHQHGWNNITDKPTVFPPSSHNHSWSSLTGKPDAFALINVTHAAVRSGRYVNSNPFPGEPVICEAQININGQWGATGWHFDVSSRHSYGVRAYEFEGTIVTQCGTMARGDSDLGGDPFNQRGGLPWPRPLRVKIWRVLQ